MLSFFWVFPFTLNRKLYTLDVRSVCDKYQVWCHVLSSQYYHHPGKRRSWMRMLALTKCQKVKSRRRRNMGPISRFQGKEKRIRGQFSSSRIERENLTQRIKKSATFSNLEKRERPTISLSLPQSLSSQRRRKWPLGGKEKS